MPLPKSPSEQPAVELNPEIFKLLSSQILESSPRMQEQYKQIADMVQKLKPNFSPEFTQALQEWASNVVAASGGFRNVEFTHYSIPNSEFDKVQEAVESEIEKAEPVEKDELRHLQIQLLRLQISQYPDLHKLSTQTVKAARNANLISIVALVLTLLSILFSIILSTT